MSTIAFEWMKLRTVRSTYIASATALVAVAAGAAWAWNVANIYDGRPIDDKISMAASAEYLVIQILPICFGVIGVLSISSEHATGMIATTLTAVPRRLRMLEGKAAVLAVFAFVMSLLCLFGAFLAGHGLVGDRPISGYTGDISEHVPLILAYAALVTTTTLVGLGLGCVMRSTAAAVVVLAALLFVVPALTNLLPVPWSDRINAFMLPSLPEQLSGTGSILEPIAAAAVLAAYVILALGAGALALNGRDV